MFVSGVCAFADKAGVDPASVGEPTQGRDLVASCDPASSGEQRRDAAPAGVRAGAVT